MTEITVNHKNLPFDFGTLDLKDGRCRTLDNADVFKFMLSQGWIQLLEKVLDCLEELSLALNSVIRRTWQNESSDNKAVLVSKI